MPQTTTSQQSNNATSGLPQIVRPVVAPITQQWANGGVKTPDGSAIGGHPGTDYGCPTGTQVKAATDGQVIYAGPASGFGDHCVSIWHPAYGVTTLYGHMEAHYVNVGDSVLAGQVIGLSDSQGNSTGPHLHLEVRPIKAPFGGNPPNIDPELWLTSHGATSKPGQVSLTGSVQPAGLNLNPFDGFGIPEAIGQAVAKVLSYMLDGAMIAAGIVCIGGGLIMAFHLEGTAKQIGKIAALVVAK